MKLCVVLAAIVVAGSAAVFDVSVHAAPQTSAPPTQVSAPQQPDSRPEDDEDRRPDADVDASDIAPGPSTLKGAIADSLRLLLIEHITRIMFQAKTRRELRGPFLEDYVRSVHMPDKWSDGDGWLVNYVGHPIHGAAAGFVWLDHEDGAHDPGLGFSAEYWKSRGRAAAWIAIYSYQFEFGPLSEASIGNVGMYPHTRGWVDHVVTPVGGLGILVAEDALDRYVIRRIERMTANRFLRAVARTGLNPSRTLANAAQGQMPWYRAARPLRH